MVSPVLFSNHMLGITTIMKLKAVYTITPWEPRELAIVRRMAKGGYTSNEAARAVGRSPGALRYKCHKLKIRFRSNGRRK